MVRFEDGCVGSRDNNQVRRSLMSLVWSKQIAVEEWSRAQVKWLYMSDMPFVQFFPLIFTWAMPRSHCNLLLPYGVWGERNGVGSLSLICHVVRERKVCKNELLRSWRELRGRWPSIKESGILFQGALASSFLFPNFLFDIFLPWEFDNQWGNIKALVSFWSSKPGCRIEVVLPPSASWILHEVLCKHSEWIRW